MIFNGAFPPGLAFQQGGMAYPLAAPGRPAFGFGPGETYQRPAAAPGPAAAPMSGGMPDRAETGIVGVKAV